jgi:hypothetical protein
MEIASSSAIANALRVGVNVVINQSRPVLEIYQEIHNNQRPPIEFSQMGHRGNSLPPTIHRFSDQFVSFTLVNIGGIRAENVLITTSGEFKREPPRDNLGERFGIEHAQMAPGQAMFLFRVELQDLWKYEADGTGAKRASGNKDEKLSFLVDYNGPDVGLNQLWRLPSKIGGRRQFRTTYIFHTLNVMGDLPPTRYA